MQIAAILIVFLPLLAGIINGLFCQRISKNRAGIISSSAIIISSFLACLVFYHVGINGKIIHITLAEWLRIDNIKIDWAIYIDQLTAIMFLVVTWVSAVVYIYSLGYMQEDDALPKFLSFLSFFTFFMLTLVSAGNLMQLFFGWEGVGFCSYLLIGFWYQKESATLAANKAFIVNRLGDFAFILGIIMIIVYSGCADLAGIFSKAEVLSEVKFSVFELEFSRLDIICLLLFLGCMGKSAQIGLHVWLPDAMEGPTPVSALIHAATMVTAGVFLVVRCSYLFEYSPIILQIMAIIGAITCIFAATVAIAQKDIKKIIAYSTCSQLGYMFLACGVSAYNAAIFHLVTHAFFKALLFLSAGSVIHACHEQDIFKMGGLKDKLPITYCNFWVGSLAIIGIYPLAGFYSKDLILESAYSAGGLGYLVFVIGIIAAIFTAIYSMKIIMLVFHGPTNLTEDTFAHVHDAPTIMNLPLIILVAGSLFSGMTGHYILGVDQPFGYFSKSILNLSIHENGGYNIPGIIKLLPLTVGLIGILLGTYLYKRQIYTIVASQMGFIYRLVQNKYYFDEIYYFIIVKPIIILRGLLNAFDQKILDRFGPNGFVKVTNGLSSVVSHIQTGYIANYALYIILAMVVCVTFFIMNFMKVV